MTINNYPRLCGGTFFVLVLQALQPRMKAKEHYHGDTDHMSDPEVLMGLCKVINPDYKEVSKKTLKGKTNDFKSCRTSTGTYLPFGETQEVKAFDSRVKNNYSEALSSMVVFVDQFIDTGKVVRKDATLVRALIDLISQDQSIDDSEEFFICEDGRAIKKAAIGSLQSVCLPAFLLGTWHYISVYRMDNTVGQETYDQWCPSHGNAPRPYKAHMGEGKYPDLKVLPAAISAQEEQDDELVIEPELETEEQEQRTDTNTASAPGTTQIWCYVKKKYKLNITNFLLLVYSFN